MEYKNKILQIFLIYVGFLIFVILFKLIRTSYIVVSTRVKKNTKGITTLILYKMKNNKNILIKQHDIADCGAACLASICAYYGAIYPISRIRQYAFTEKKGTNILGMIKASERLGLTAKGVKADYEALHSVMLPMIAHVIIDDRLQHFIVVYKITNDCIEYMDPVDGEIHKTHIESFLNMWTGVLILIEPNAHFQKGNMKKSNWENLYNLFSPHFSVMSKILFGAICCSLLGLAVPLYIGKTIDVALPKGDVSLLNALGVGVTILIIVRVLLSFIKSLMALKTSQLIDSTLILGYYKHILRMPQFFFDTMRVGEIISRVNDAVKIRVFINDIAVELIVNILILFSSIVFMLVFSWRLTLVTMGSVPLFILVFWFFNKMNKKYQRRIMETTAELESQLVESVSNIFTIKRFNVENHACIQTESNLSKMLKGIYNSSKMKIVTSNALDLIASICTISILWIGGFYITKNSMSIGTLMLFYSLIGMMFSPIATLINANRTIQDALIATDRLFQILDLEIEPPDDNQISINRESVGDICFENIMFQYGSRKPLFDSFNLQIEKGKTTAIVGASGSGKTTITALLQKVYPIQSGHIYIGKYDLAEVSTTSLRQIIGVIPQKVELFSGTILSNIALGVINPDIERITKIISDLGLRDFIDELPQGVETKVGEQGATFSGGEKQRIAIARALYRNPEIIIFDEATSSLDATSEQYVKQVIAKLRLQHKTIIIIAHRLATIKDVDNILVIEKGKIKETGTYKQLMQKQGVFFNQWQSQFGFS